MTDRPYDATRDYPTPEGGWRIAPSARSTDARLALDTLRHSAEGREFSATVRPHLAAALLAHVRELEQDKERHAQDKERKRAKKEAKRAGRILPEAERAGSPATGSVPVLEHARLGTV